MSIPTERKTWHQALNVAIIVLMSIHKFNLIHSRFTLTVLFISSTFLYLLILTIYSNDAKRLNAKANVEQSKKIAFEVKLKQTARELEQMRNDDQFVRNEKLQADITSIEKTYGQAVKTYELLLDLKTVAKKTVALDAAFSDSLTLLSKRSYASAEARLSKLTVDIRKEKETILASFVIPANLPTDNAPPSSGYRRQLVQTDIGSFMVDIVTADLNSTRVIVDTASDGDCADNCPVLPLGAYVSRSGAYAGVNGSYFCPASYPSCSGKTNSFDTLLMNKNKTYFNSTNNVYSTVPAAIFTGNSARFVGQSLEWGRYTGIDAVIANRPLLVSNGQNVFGGSDQAKEGAKGARSFVGASGNTAYIGVVFNATVGESAKALQTLGIQNALNLDDGGSTALWFGGYKAGPGRDLPNVVLFVRK